MVHAGTNNAYFDAYSPFWNETGGSKWKSTKQNKLRQNKRG